jgi:hypothetical protein
MENRDRDKLSKNDWSSQSDDVNREKNDSESNFGQNIGRSESLDKEPSRRSGGGSSSSDLDEQSDVSSSRSGSRSSSGMTEH